MKKEDRKKLSIATLVVLSAVTLGFTIGYLSGYSHNEVLSLKDYWQCMEWKSFEPVYTTFVLREEGISCIINETLTNVAIESSYPYTIYTCQKEEVCTKEGKNCKEVFIDNSKYCKSVREFTGVYICWDECKEEYWNCFKKELICEEYR